MLDKGRARPQCYSLVKVKSLFAEMMATKDVRDTEGSSMHQLLLTPDETLILVVQQCGQLCLANTELPYIL